MRELSEIKAEVFRRSEKRIKEKKHKRTRALATVLPLCLVIVVCSVMLLPKLLPVGHDGATTGTLDGNENYDTLQDENLNNYENSSSIVCSYTEVLIIASDSKEEPVRITDKAKIAQIFSAVFVSEEATYQDDGNTDIVVGGSTQDQNYKGETSEIIITFLTDDGLRTDYKLTENQLCKVGTNTKIMLSSEQTENLKTLLGVEN